jgi:hypothetical protein
LLALRRIAVTAVADAKAFKKELLAPEVFFQFGFEGSLNGRFDQLLKEGFEVFLGLNVLCQLGPCLCATRAPYRGFCADCVWY